MSGGEPAAAARPPRVHALDGLRGLAAFIVVIHHSILTGRLFSVAYEQPTAFPRTNPEWWLTYTPLHLVWEGTGAVYVFFVLSGYVLTLPLMRRRRDVAGWVAYYPARLIRLYLPTWGAVAFALVLFFLVTRHVVVDGSGWLSSHASKESLHNVISDVILVRGTTALNTPLWSLRWEVIFSLLLPAFVYLAFALRRWSLVIALLSFLIVSIGAMSDQPALTYLPMFMLGVLVAAAGDSLTRVSARLSRPAWFVVVAAGLLLLNLRWLLAALGDTGSDTHGIPLAVLGALLLVLAAIHWDPAQRFLEWTPLQWLGKRSFSLYLVHEPIIVSVALLIGTTVNPLPVLLIGVPLSLGAAQLFFLLVERHAHNFSRWTGRTVAARLAPPPADHAETPPTAIA